MKKNLKETNEKTKKFKAEFELEFIEKTKNLDLKLLKKAEEIKKEYQKKFNLEEDLRSKHLKIKERAIEEQRTLLINQAAELEDKFLNTLQEKEAETAKSFKETMETFNSRSLKERENHSIETNAISSEFEKELEKIKKHYETALNEKDIFFKNQGSEIKAALQASFNEAMETEREKIKIQFEAQIEESENANEILREKNTSLTNEKSLIRRDKSKLKEASQSLRARLDKMEEDKQSLIRNNLSKSKNLRQSLEKDYLDKFKKFERNYLEQITDIIKNSNQTEETRQNEYFEKLEYIKNQLADNHQKQIEEIEKSYSQREIRFLNATKKTYQLKEQTLQSRHDQLENNYQTLLMSKLMELDHDKTVAENINALKKELETKGRELNTKIAAEDLRIQNFKTELENKYVSTKTELENDNKIKTHQLATERTQLKILIEQEQTIISDIQKREKSLQENFNRKETHMLKEFENLRERLEKEYQEKLNSLKNAK